MEGSTTLSVFLASVVPAIVGVAVGGFALPISKTIVAGWVRLHTAITPEVGEALRREIVSDIHDQISSWLAEGLGPGEIVAQMLVGRVTGFLDDVSRYAPLVRSAPVNQVTGAEQVSQELSGPRASDYIAGRFW